MKSSELVDYLAHEILVKCAKHPSGKLYASSNGVYIPGGWREIEQAVQVICMTENLSWDVRLGYDVGQTVAANAPTIWQAPPTDRLNLLNGTLDLRTGVLEPHTPDWLSTI